MKLRAIGFWTGVNATLLYVHLFDAVLRNSALSLGLAMVAAAGMCLGFLTKEAA
jgi:hypothetical protein